MCVGISFHRSRVWQISLVLTHCSSGFWLVGFGFSVRLHFLVWVVWLFRDWPGLSGGDLGPTSSWFTVSCAVQKTLTLHAGGN